MNLKPTNQPQNCGAVERQSQLSRELDSANCQVDSLDKIVSALAQRLQPLLRDECPTESDCKMAIETIVPVADIVRSTTRRIGNITDRLDSILNRIEL